MELSHLSLIALAQGPGDAVAFELIEHTADVGVRAEAETLEGCFAEATLGMLSVAGVYRPAAGEILEIEAEGRDLEATLVEWLSEILYLYDARDAVVTAIRLDQVTPAAARGAVSLAPRADEEIEGTQVKAVTFHRIRVDRTDGGWECEVYLDV